MRQYSRILVSLLVIISTLGVAPLSAAGQSTDTALSTDATLSTESAALHETDTNHTQFPVTLTDATGTEVTVTERPSRVTTTSPSAAQVMWELGAESQVVGVTKFAHYLDGAEDRENVSSTEFGVSIERVVATDPDLVLAPNSTSQETVETLRDAGLTVYHFPEATDFEDVKDKTLRIGQLTGNEKQAIETNAWVDANVEKITTATTDAERPKLMYPLLGGFAVGGNTFIHEIIGAAGANNVAAQEFDGYEVVNDETVLTLDPEILIVTDQTEGQILNSEPYSLTTAGQNNQSAFLEVNYVNQPAPRSVVYSTRNLTAQIHPDLYDESDFVTRSEAAASLDQSSETDGENETDETTTDTTGEPTANDDGTGVSAPGFGVVVAVVSLLGGGLLARRRSN